MFDFSLKYWLLAFSCEVRSDQGALSKPFHKSLHSEEITSDNIRGDNIKHLANYTYIGFAILSWHLEAIAASLIFERKRL